MINIVNYETDDGESPFEEWLGSLKSVQDKVRILKELDKLEMGLLSEIKPVGGGVQEKRLHFKPTAYRLYFGYDGDKLIILLSGSTKDDHKQEIKKALSYWQDYKRQKALKARSQFTKGAQT